MFTNMCLRSLRLMWRPGFIASLYDAIAKYDLSDFLNWFDNGSFHYTMTGEGQ